MNTKRTLLWFLISLILLPGCQQDDAGSDLRVSKKSDFDPAIIKTLEGYNLSLSDFELSLTGNEGNTSNLRLTNRVTQKTVNIGNEVITYFETSGKGPDVLLIHGATQSSNSYKFQLNSVLGNIFHIISIDLPGHGLSQKSPDPAVTYQLPGYADIVVDLVEKLNMQRAVIVGWSLGGNILLQASNRLTKARGLMILGCSPVSIPFDPNAFIPSDEFGLLFKPDLTEAEIQTLVPKFFRPNIPFTSEVFYQDVRIQDPLARLYLGVTVGTANYTDQVGIVGNLSVPLAILDGEQEQITNISYQKSLTIPTLWHHKVFAIPNSGHMTQWENPLYFNVLLAAFVIESNFHQ